MSQALHTISLALGMQHSCDSACFLLHSRRALPTHDVTFLRARRRSHSHRHLECFDFSHLTGHLWMYVRCLEPTLRNHGGWVFCISVRSPPRHRDVGAVRLPGAGHLQLGAPDLFRSMDGHEINSSPGRYLNAIQLHETNVWLLKNL